MEKDKLVKEIIQNSGKWVLLLTTLYFGLIFFCYWYHLGVLLHIFRIVFYLLSFIIPINYLTFLFLSKQKIFLKIFVSIIVIPLYFLGGYSIVLFPIVLAETQLQNETFYLTREPELFDIHTFLKLYKCKYKVFDCYQVNYSQMDPSQVNFKLIADSKVGEIHVRATFLNNKEFLIYAYGNPSRYYDYPEQFGNQLYYLAYDDQFNNQQTNYWVYKCNLDSTHCNRIPFQFTTIENRFYISIETDKITGEINLLGRNKELIFTYGEHPRCYVEGCEILEETK